MEPRVATDRYSSRAALIFISVSVAVESLVRTSSAVALVTRRTLISDSSSTKLPSVEVRRSKRLSSRSATFCLFSVTSSNKLVRSASNS